MSRLPAFSRRQPRLRIPTTRQQQETDGPFFGPIAALGVPAAAPMAVEVDFPLEDLPAAG
jgi:hypothetical protein